MTARNALVIIEGQVQEMPSGDSLNGASGGSSIASNIISTPTTIAADTSYIVVGYLEITSTFEVAGNVGIL